MRFQNFFKKMPLLLLCVVSLSAAANNMLVQNVTTLGNNPANKTIQVQFDISWDNSWRDSINWDAAWIFIKFKNANGLWQHARLNLGGFNNGTGTANIVKVTSDSVGCWIYRNALGSGTFNSTAMQLQWNYGSSGLSDVTGLEVRVFAVEMVYVPEGEFNVAKGYVNYIGDIARNCEFTAPANNFPVINTRLTPPLTFSDGTQSILRIKGDAGIDYNNDGIVEVSNYPTGFKSFYCYKYEMSEQQYADFVNTLTDVQINNLGIAGTSSLFLNGTILQVNGEYFSSAPNKACGNSNAARLFAYADWAGLRPISILEFNKASYGPIRPEPIDGYFGTGGVPAGVVYPAYGSYYISEYFPFEDEFERGSLLQVGLVANLYASFGKPLTGASYYGIIDLTANAIEPVVSLSQSHFDTENGDGNLLIDGSTDMINWDSSKILYIDQKFTRSNYGSSISKSYYGFRYVRSAE